MEREKLKVGRPPALIFNELRKGKWKEKSETLNVESETWNERERE